MGDYLEIFVTIDNKKSAWKIAGELIGKRLASCVQIGGPIKSLYIWKGRRCVTKEWTLTIKSAADKYNSIERTVKELHPYQTPEIISRKIEGGSREYFKWMDEILL
jgi:periplasmic divalent cation tolerance protein